MMPQPVYKPIHTDTNLPVLFVKFMDEPFIILICPKVLMKSVPPLSASTVLLMYVREPFSLTRLADTCTVQHPFMNQGCQCKDTSVRVRLCVRVRMFECIFSGWVNKTTVTVNANSPYSMHRLRYTHTSVDVPMLF